MPTRALGARRTWMTPVSSWASTTSAAGRTTGQAQSRRLGRGFLGAPEPRDPLGPTRARPAIQESSLAGRERRGFESSAWRSTIGSTSIPTGRPDRVRPGRRRPHRHARSRWRAALHACGLANSRQQGPAVFVGDDRQIGWINRRIGRRRSRAAGRPPWPRSGPRVAATAALRNPPLAR